MVTQSLLWTQKYMPTSEKEIVGNPTAVKNVDNYIRNFRKSTLKEGTSKKDTSKKNAIILIGPPGTGKTATVYVMARKFNYDLMELNASDFRNEQMIKRKIGITAMEKSITGKKKTIILVDEVDGISGVQDRGGIGAIIKIIKETRNPIILTANDISDQKFTTLKRYVKQIKFQPIKKQTILKVLQKICQKENVTYDDKILEQLSENAKGDLRAAINDLQSVAEGKNHITIDDIKNLHQLRDEEKTIFEALKIIFRERNIETIQKTLWQLNISTREFGLLMQRINEIIPEHMKDPEELANAFLALSNADIVWGRIQRKREKDIWRLFPYFSIELAAGVSLARTETPYHFVNYYTAFPRFFFQNLGKLRRGDLAGIGEKIRTRCHLSISKAISEYLPFFSIIYQKNPKMAEKLSKYFNFDKKEDRFLKNFWK